MLDFSRFSGKKEFLSFFEEISKIPRGSGNCKSIADYLENFARERGLSFIRDNTDTVLIKKSAAAGYENAPTVILQGHSDMVIATNEKYEGDILTDGVKPYIDGEFLKARASTLGADNGIAVAYMLALLDSEGAAHPPIEALFTADEEIGLIGAGGFDASLLRGKILINLDAGAEGIFIAGCAGGETIDITLDFETKEVNEYCEISLSGLRGGHSGDKIHEGRLNAIKLIPEIADTLGMIGNLNGGSADNAIADSVTFSASLSEGLEEKIDALTKKWKRIENNIRIDYSIKREKTTLLTSADTKRLTSLISALPYGPLEMMESNASLVMTSANLGVIKTNEKEVTLSASIRSASDKRKESLDAMICDIAKKFGAKAKCYGKYPGWEYRNDSEIREILGEVFALLYGKEAKTVTIHAGLECGIFASEIEGLDCVSIGPAMHDIHTPAERLSIPSAIKYYELLLKALANIKEKR